MNPAIRYLALVIVALASLVSTASAKPSDPLLTNTVVLTDDQGEYPLGRHLMILEDPTKQLTIDDVQKQQYEQKFVPSASESPGFGFSPSAYWAKVYITAPGEQSTEMIFEQAYAPTQSIEVHTLRSDGTISHQKGGTTLRFTDRPFPHHKHIFPLTMTPGQNVIYVRVDGENSKSLSFKLYSSKIFTVVASKELYVIGAYFGLITGLMFYNLFIFLTVKEMSYLYYVLFLASFMLFTASLNGLAQQWLWPGSTAWTVHSIPTTIAAVALFAGVFTSSFLNTKHTMPTLHNLLVVGTAWSILSLFIPEFMSYHISIINATAFTAAYSGLGVVIAFFAVVQRIKAAIYYFLSWLLLLIGTTSYALKALGVFPDNALTRNGFLLGSAMEAILLSLALAARMRVMKEEKERAQDEQIRTQKTLHEAQQESLSNKQIALETIKKYSIKLEAEVKIRTAELIDTQQKLIASEKMAALGVFTAGMAHEINNPANFVAAGAQNAEYAAHKLQTFVGELLDEDVDPDIKGEFHTHFTKISDAHEVIKTGIKRIENVVKQLRSAHPEGDVGIQPADIVDSLESAWRVLSPTVKTPIVISTQFDARPQVPCMIAEINQVFLALLSNAAHAIEDAAAVSGPDYKGEIRLASHEADGSLVISVSDNGIGIPADKIGKVFDPFFTTKTVGRGAGLGLSMAWDVVRKHGGTLEVHSEAGFGSCFEVSLPVSAGA